MLKYNKLKEVVRKYERVFGYNNRGYKEEYMVSLFSLKLLLHYINVNGYNNVTNVINKNGGLVMQNQVWLCKATTVRKQ